MEDDEVVRRYVEMDDETRRNIEENKLHSLNNADICGCSQHADGKVSSAQQPYEHIRWTKTFRFAFQLGIILNRYISEML